MAEESYSDIKVEDVDPSKMRLVLYQGMPMTEFRVPVDIQMKNVKAMNFRADDVLLCSYPKSGTHWVWRILDMLLSGSSQYGSRIPNACFLDVMPPQTLNRLQSPRVLPCHLPLDFLPDQIKDGGTKMVHVYRNPKAVMASLFFQLVSIDMMPGVTIQTMAEQIFSDTAPYHSMFFYFDQMAEFQKQNPKLKVFHIAYEDLKQNTKENIKKLSDYLGVDASDKLCSDIADAVSFKKQKEEEEKRQTPALNSSEFYRKGEIADWKNHLTVSVSERMDQILEERKDRCPFSRRYAQTAE